MGTMGPQKKHTRTNSHGSGHLLEEPHPQVHTNMEFVMIPYPSVAFPTTFLGVEFIIQFAKTRTG